MYVAIRHLDHLNARPLDLTEESFTHPKSRFFVGLGENIHRACGDTRFELSRNDSRVIFLDK